MEEIDDAGINRFDDVNPNNVPTAASVAVTQPDGNTSDGSGSQPPTRTRVTRSTSAMNVKKKLPTSFESGEGRVLLGSILGFIRGQGWNKIQGSKGAWFDHNTTALFDETSRGVLSE